MSNKASASSAGESAPVKVAKTTTAPPALATAAATSTSRPSPKTGPTSLSGIVRHSGITPASTPTESGQPPTLPAPSASASTSKASTAASTPLLKREASRAGAPALSISIPADASAAAADKGSSAASAAAGGHTTTTTTSTVTAHPPSPPSATASGPTHAESPIDDRGWDAVMDGRFRVSLMHHFAEDVDEGEQHSGTKGTAQHSAFTNAVPDELSAEAAALCEEEAHQTPTHDAFCNKYRPGEPCIEVDVEASLVNAINSAYTSTGYPFVVTAGNTRGAVYGSFVDTSNPSLSSLEMPPAQSFIVAPSYTGGQASAHGVTEMDTLLAIRWGRGDRMMTAAGSVAAAAVAASQGKSTLSSSVAGSAKEVKAASPGSVPPPSSAGPAGSPHSPAVARTIAHHLTQYPEGIHGTHSSMHLRTVLVDGALPTVQAVSPSAPINTIFSAPLAVAGGNVGAPLRATTPAPAAASGGTPGPEEAATGAAPAGSPTAPLPANAEANVPPLPRPTESNAPVQHTLVSASTFNHLSVYVVAHQDGKMIYTAALQSLSASIATRKVTAHQLILVGREEVEGMSNGPLAAVTLKPPRRSNIAFANVPVTGGEAAVFFQSKTSRFVGADAVRRTVAAAPIRFTVEPHLLFGNQNGDIFIFSLLQERIVQHINFNAGSQQVCTAIASGNSGAGSKLICSPVSSIVEVQNGIEKKITAMVEYATVAKRNRRSSFESDDVPSAFTPTGATAPSHYYYPVPPSLYAVGFDNGQMLLLCVTCEGGWMLRHFSSQYFGLRPIHSIAVRVPPFYTRLWTSCLPAMAKSEGTTTGDAAPLTALVTPEQALLVHEEEQHIAAVACNGGVIALVRLPGMEILSSVAPTDYNAVGEILALQWTATSTRCLLTPDVLVASGEDDAMTAFQLLTPAMTSAAESSYHPHNNNNNNGETVSHLSSTESVLAGGRLRILEKKRFHRSWVSRLNLFPIVLPATASATAAQRTTGNGSGSNGGSGGGTGGHNGQGAGRAGSSAKRVTCASGGGMPQYVGVCLVATSYDRRTSFWPYIFSNSEDLGEDGSAVSGNHSMHTGDQPDFGNGSGGLMNTIPSITPAPDHYVLVDGPTAAYPLHTELVISVAAAGGGTSFFLTTVCCRGKVKFWSMNVKV